MSKQGGYMADNSRVSGTQNFSKHYFDEKLSKLAKLSEGKPIRIVGSSFHQSIGS